MPIYIEKIKTLIIIGSIVSIGGLEIIFAFYAFKKNYFERVLSNYSLGVINALIIGVTTTSFLIWWWNAIIVFSIVFTMALFVEEYFLKRLNKGIIYFFRLPGCI